MEINEFEQFIEQYEKDIYSFCRYLTMEDDLADDLYQDTILKAFESMGRIDVYQNPKSFLFSIAAGKWKNSWRKKKRRNEIAPVTAIQEVEADISSGETPENRLEKEMLREAVESGLAALDHKFRLPLVLYYFEEFNLADIASICKLPQGTVKSRLNRARTLLKEWLKKEGWFYYE